MLFNHTALSEFSIDDIDTLCQQYLTILYEHIPGKNKSTLAKQDVCETYGEILYPSVDKLINAIEPTEKDVLVDLGSGMGKIVIQFFLKSRIKEAYGIELVSELHQQALNAANKLQHDLPEFYNNNRTICFRQGSFLELSFSNATIALVNSACFTQSLLNELGNILENTPGIHTVLSLRPIHTLSRLIFKKAIPIECSWDSALCYIYGK